MCVSSARVAASTGATRQSRWDAVTCNTAVAKRRLITGTNENKRVGIFVTRESCTTVRLRTCDWLKALLLLLLLLLLLGPSQSTMADILLSASSCSLFRKKENMQQTTQPLTRRAPRMNPQAHVSTSLSHLFSLLHRKYTEILTTYTEIPRVLVYLCFLTSCCVAWQWLVQGCGLFSPHCLSCIPWQIPARTPSPSLHWFPN